MTSISDAQRLEAERLRPVPRNPARPVPRDPVLSEPLDELFTRLLDLISEACREAGMLPGGTE